MDAERFDLSQRVAPLGSAFVTALIAENIMGLCFMQLQFSLCRRSPLMEIRGILLGDFSAQTVEPRYLPKVTTKSNFTLDRLMLESDRIRFEQLAIEDFGRLPEIIEEFSAKIAEVGPNPYKGF